MRKFEVKNPSKEAINEAYLLWLNKIKCTKQLAEIEKLNIYYLHEIKENFGIYSSLHDFAFNLMIKLKVNEIKPNNIKIVTLKTGAEWITIFDLPAKIVYKNFYEKDCIQSLYYKKLGWEK